LHDDVLTFKQSSSYGRFDVLVIVFSHCYFLVVHLHHDHRVTTFELLTFQLIPYPYTIHLNFIGWLVVKFLVLKISFQCCLKNGNLMTMNILVGYSC